MSALKKYLDENHKSPDKLNDDFQNKFGVNVKQEGDLYLFKYGLITAKWDEITKECRGAILKLTSNGWKFMSRPFDKFFNQHEGHCPIFNPKAFAEALPSAALVEKADGTCIQLWHDDERWRVSTLGTITTLNVFDNDITFEQLFLDTVFRVFWDELDKEFTYLFELCCDMNRIVTQYKTDHVVYLGAREKDSGWYLSDHELDYEINDGAFREANIRRPQFVFPHELGVRSLDEVKAFIEEMSATEKYGKYSEGFVVYDLENLHPIAKMKNAKYMSLHHVGGGDIAHSKNQIIDAIFLGYIDDIYDALSDRLKKFSDDVKEKALSIRSNALQTFDKMKEIDFPTRKAYAVFVQDHAEKQVQSFFFKNANEFMNKADDVVDKFDLWMKDNYGKFDWKSDGEDLSDM